MPKDSRGRPGETEDATAKQSDIPPEIAQLIEIEGRSVRIDPRRYFSKMFRAVLPLIQHRLKESAPNTFTLKPRLFEDFLYRLRYFLEERADPTYARFEPSDWVAFALVSLPICRGLSQSGYDIDRKHYRELIAIHSEGHWEHISLPTSLIGTPTSGSGQQDSNRVSLNVVFSDPLEPDKFVLEIDIVGEPLRPFFELEAILKMTPAEKRELQRRAKAIWSVLNERISSRLGTQPLQAGRLLTDQGASSALLHDHFGYSWTKVAQELCKDQLCKDEKGHWKHSHWCRERYRKLAALHWKREANKYAAMARESQTPQASVDAVDAADPNTAGAGFG